MRHASARSFSGSKTVAFAVVLLLSGCAAPADDDASSDVNLGNLDAYELSDLLPSAAEVSQRLGWVENETYTSPPFDAEQLDLDVEQLIDAFGGPLAVGVECADALRAGGAIPLFPVGATDAASNQWVEDGVTVREMTLARFPSVEAARAQIVGLPDVIDACPPLAVPGSRQIAVVPTSVEGAVAFSAADSYSWVVASYGNLWVQVSVGLSPEEFESADALLQMQLDKLELISRGDYE